MAARLEASRPLWDIELTEAGCGFFLPWTTGALDGELAILEEGCRQVERMREGLTVSLAVTREHETGEPASRPAALGPWLLTREKSGVSEAVIALPPELSLSQPRWAGEHLLAGLINAHLTPSPGGPATRWRPALSLAAGWSLAPLAALLAGSGPVTALAEDEVTAARISLLAEWNGRPVKVEAGPFSGLGRLRPDWAGAFGFILARLSPYLTARRLRTLTRWLAPGGVIMAAGFAPGPQTAHLLRAAVRAGLALDSSELNAGWAAVRMSLKTPGPELPPLTGSVVPAMADCPEGQDQGKADEEPGSLMTEDWEDE